MDTVIEVRDLRMRYGEQDVLHGVDFEVRRGEVVCLLGPNGAGKTTTIEILEGFRARSAGTVQVLGQDPAGADDAWRARVGVVLQSWRDHARWTPRLLLAHLAGFYTVPGREPGQEPPQEPSQEPEQRQRPGPVPVDALLEQVGLSASADQKIATLSGGQRRRLDVAVGIVGRPELLFLDEPTAGFDPHARRDFHELVHRLSDAEGTSILLTTHDLAEAERLADRILILASGRIVADGSPDALARRIDRASQVRWSVNGQAFVHATDEPARFVHDLVVQHGSAVSDLEVLRASLEDTYLTLVQRSESGQADAADHFLEAVR
jgi:ABC-2 type transport system ATP-binding protein